MAPHVDCVEKWSYNWDLRIIVYVPQYAKQKQLGAVKKGAAKLSRIISITGKIKNWYQVAAK